MENLTLTTKAHTELPEDINQQLEICQHKKHTHQVKLDVIAVISNPVRFERRYQLFREFCARMSKEPQVRLTTVELQQGTRPFATNSKLRYRTNDEIWYKENLINLGILHLPEDAEYIGWVDTDIEFQDPNWARETLEQLQIYDVVQPFSHAIDLGPNGETMQVHTGFIYQYVNKGEWTNDKYGRYYHPGYACFYKKKTINAMGGLIDFAIFGSADYHMMGALVGQVERTLHKNINVNYRMLCMNFQERCERHIKRNIGFTHGTILHSWHSCKSRRRYGDRPAVLARLNFDPLRDLKKNWQGLWLLEDLNIALRDEIRHYFRSRHEDSIDLFQDYNYTKKDWI